MTSFSLIIFDLDGTLIDSRRDISESVNRMLRALSRPEKTEDEIASYVGNGVHNLIRASLGEANAELADRALNIFQREYDTHLLDHTKLYPGVKEKLATLSVPKVVLTNKPLAFSEKILDGLGIRQHFARVLGGDMHFPKKPSPDAVYYLAKELNVKLEEILIVGDSPLDIQTGKAAGTQTCAVTYGFGKRDELAAAKPDYLIETFPELLKL